jgi:hypothetical protein
MTENQRPERAGVPAPGDDPGAGRDLAPAGQDNAGPAETPNPLASAQLVENPQADTQVADDPLGGKQPADDPLGSDPLTLDRRNPPRAPGH